MLFQKLAKILEPIQEKTTPKNEDIKIDLDDFMKLDLRTGIILEAENIKKSNR